MTDSRTDNVRRKLRKMEPVPIVDDAATDRTAEAMRRYRTYLIAYRLMVKDVMCGNSGGVSDPWDS